MVKAQIALFPDWSAAVYVITCVPWLNLSNGLRFDDMVGRIPELSVARGSIQFTSAENRPRSAYATNGLDGHVAPNVGESMSRIWTTSPLETPLWIVMSYHMFRMSYSWNYLFILRRFCMLHCLC